MDKDSAGDILVELQEIKKLLALAAVDGKKQVKQIDFLMRAGLGEKDTAELLGTTKGTVSVTRAKLRKRLRQAKASCRGKGKGGSDGK